MKRILIVDGTNIFIRNYTVLPNLSQHGQSTGGIFGTLTSLGFYARTMEPDRIIIVWDGPGGSKRRKKILSHYKAGRKPLKLNRNFKFEEEDQEINKKYQQYNLIQCLKDLPVSQISVSDIEADDVIAYLVNYYSTERKIIVSSDKDFYQLLDERTVIFTPTTKKYLTRKSIVEKFQIHPKNFAVARSIIGDNSDNLKGISGIGEKRVCKLFPELREDKEITLDDLFEICKGDEKKYERILEGKKTIEDNYTVMQLKDPLISVVSIKKINSCLSEEISFNASAFQVKLMNDGIENLGMNFLRSFRLLEIKGRNNGRS